jgi:hypothetical protein
MAVAASLLAREWSAMATVLCVLYDDPVDGYPPRTPANRRA